MEHILTGIIIVSWVITYVYLIDKAISNSVIHMILLVVFTVITLAGVSYALNEKEKEGPCIEYETTTMYSNATKTMMPVRYCIKRGEWIDENTN